MKKYKPNYGQWGYHQTTLFATSDVVDPTISAEQYQLQHAHSNILKKPLDEVLPEGPSETTFITSKFR